MQARNSRRLVWKESTIAQPVQKRKWHRLPLFCLPQCETLKENQMANNTDNEAQDNASGFDKNAFLQQVTNEQTKKEREALKGKVGALMTKRKEARRAVAAIDLEIEKEIAAFQAGL
jgi:hypothetical protein